jgi:hypothetical protein
MEGYKDSHNSGMTIKENVEAWKNRIIERGFIGGVIGTIFGATTGMIFGAFIGAVKIGGLGLVGIIIEALFQGIIWTILGSVSGALIGGLVSIVVELFRA